MGEHNKYRDLVPAQPGWYVAMCEEESPFYKLLPIVCWAIYDGRRTSELDSGIVALIVNEEFMTLTEPNYEGWDFAICHQTELDDPLGRESLSNRGKARAAKDRDMTIKQYDEMLKEWAERRALTPP